MCEAAAGAVGAAAGAAVVETGAGVVETVGNAPTVAWARITGGGGLVGLSTGLGRVAALAWAVALARGGGGLPGRSPLGAALW